MCLLSIFFNNSAYQRENIHILSVDALGRTVQQQTHQESEAQSEEEIFGSASKVVENEETEGPSHSEGIHNPSLLAAAGTDTEREVKVGMEVMESIEDELIEDDIDEQPLSPRPSNIHHEQAEHIDGHALNGEEIHAEDIKPTILRVIYQKAQECQHGGEVQLARYVEMYRHLLNFFHIFGTFASVQGRMLESRLYSLESYIHSRDGPHYIMLSAMIHFEDVTGRISRISPFSGTAIFTCLQRHLQFMTRCLANVLTLRLDMSLLHAFRTAYQEVLSIHHAWFVDNFYLAGIGMLPTKEAALQGMVSIQGEDQVISMEVLQSSILAIVRALHQVTKVSEAALVTTNALQKIPKKVVT